MNDDSRFQAQRHPLQQMNQADEISLVDIALVFVRHKWVFSVVVVAGLVVGALFAWFKPLTYTYTTLIEIGTQIVEGEPRPLESPSGALAKVQASYLPLAQRSFLQENSAESGIIAVNVSNPSDSALLRLESTGTPDMAAAFQTVHTAIANRLLQDHQRITDVIRKDKENDLNARQNDLARLEASHAVLQSNLQRMDIVHANELTSVRAQAAVLSTERKRLEQTEGLIKAQVAKYEQLITTAEQNRNNAVNEVTDEARAMTLLMINNEIQQNRNQLLGLQERLSVGIPNERDRLAKAIEDNQRQQQNLKAQQANERDDLLQKIAENGRTQSEIKNQIESLKLGISNLRQTRVIATATQSAKPAGLEPVMVVALFVMLGGFLGCCMVLLLEFMAAARRRQAELENG